MQSQKHGACLLHNIISSFSRNSRSFTTARNINKSRQIPNDKKTWKHRKKLLSNHAEDPSHSMNYIAIPLEFRGITTQISNQQSADTVLAIFRDSELSCNDTSVYAMGIRKCNTLNDSNTAMQIFDLVKQRNIPRNAAIYSLLIHALCNNNRLKRAQNLFQEMKECDGIKTTENVYTALLGGCKRNDVEFAEEIWNEMCVNDQITISAMSYTVMITLYGKAGMVEKAESLWLEFNRPTNSDKNSDRNFDGNQHGNTVNAVNVPNGAICCAMINCFTSSLMPHKAMQIFEFMKNHQIPIDIVHYSSLIGCLLKMNAPNKAMRIFNELKGNDIELNHEAFIQLCTVQYQSLWNEMNEVNHVNDKRVKSHFDAFRRLERQYRRFMEMEEVKRRFGVILFDAMLLMKNKGRNGVPVNDKKLCVEFRRMVNEGYLPGYWKKNGNRWMIDLHYHSQNAVGFVLRYVFEYERQFVGKEMMVICGKSSHSSYVTTQMTMKECVRLELLSWNPSIKTYVDPTNSGLLLLDEKDLTQYLKNNVISCYYP